MKSTYLILFVSLFIYIFAGQTAQAAPSAPLNGTYTIGSTGDYNSINAAVSDLNSLGTSSSVIFRIAPGNYNEQVTINAINRTGNATDPVTFEAVGNVGWGYSSAAPLTNWVVKLTDADYVVFDGVHFRAAEVGAPNGNLVVLQGADNVTLQNAQLTGLLGGASDAATLIPAKSSSNLTITGTLLSNGYRAIDIGSTVDISGLTVTDNTFNNQFNAAIVVADVDDGVIDGNLIEDGRDTSGLYAAISADSNNLTVTNNQIAVNTGARGIELLGAEFANHSISNNMITLGGNNADSGIYLGDLDVTVQHNSVYVDSSSSAAFAFRTAAFPVTPADRIVNQNNIYVNVGAGGAMDFDSDPAGSNYNNLFATGATLVADGGVNYATLAAYQAASGQDADSTSVAVTFADVVSDFADLHLAGASASDDRLIAQAVGISADIDGDPRGSVGVIKGADEGSSIPLDNGDTTGGSYTVGGSSPDYVDVNRAVLVLSTRGIKGDVTFDIAAGDYETHAIIEDLVRHNGATTNPITFRAEDSADRPTLRRPVDTSKNWVFLIEDADYLVFDNLDFLSEGSGSYGTLIRFHSGANDNLLSNNTFTGVTGGIHTNTNAVLVLFNQSASAHRNQITDNVFNNGVNQIAFATTSVSTAQSSGTQIRGNHFNMRDDGTLQFIRTNDLIFANNVITHTSSDGGSVVYLSSVDDFEITGNRIDGSSNSLTGIELRDADGVDAPALIANNFVSAGKALDCNAANSNNTSNVLIYHNTFYGTGSNTVVIAEGCDQIQLKNNIIHTKDSNDQALLADASASFLSSDYNLFYNGSGSDPIIKWEDVEYATLADFQAATGFEPNSVEPAAALEFVDAINGDLHLTGASIGDSLLFGTPLATILTDIDGETRSATAPYMGADEPMGTTPTAVGLSQVSATSAGSGQAETYPPSSLIATVLLVILLSLISLRLHDSKQQSF